MTTKEEQLHSLSKTIGAVKMAMLITDELMEKPEYMFRESVDQCLSDARWNLGQAYSQLQKDRRELTRDMEGS